MYIVAQHTAGRCPGTGETMQYQMLRQQLLSKNFPLDTEVMMGRLTVDVYEETTLYAGGDGGDGGCDGGGSDGAFFDATYDAGYDAEFDAEFDASFDAGGGGGGQ